VSVGDAKIEVDVTGLINPEGAARWLAVQIKRAMYGVNGNEDFGWTVKLNGEVIDEYSR
jgi:hypothetical protein